MQLIEPTWLHNVAIITPFIGMLFSWFYFKTYRITPLKGTEHNIQPSDGKFAEFCRQGLGFDACYNVLLVKPYHWLAQINKHDIFDQIIMLNAWYVSLWHDSLIFVQSGSLRWYIAAFGLAIMLLLGVSLL
jgi:NADH-quinone oxidoreductase subunit L